jgi:serine phosphatase RsbU (regulator of sigma subunit)
MERLVRERTRQLAETNQQIMDSIDYAKRIQTSLLPTNNEMEQAFAEHFVVWRPRDVVGGDFYWLRRSKDSSILAVGDCTGHGVPGALMTMVVNTVLNHIVDETAWDNPALIIQKLNDGVRETIHRQQSDQLTDDGLDIALCYIGPEGRLVFASARLSLLIWNGGEVQRITGIRKSVGCRRSSAGLDCTNQEIVLQAKNVCYLTTDGFIDQNGSENSYPFGRKRFIQAIGSVAELPLAEQKVALERMLSEYMGSEPQRDDITVIAVKIWDEARGEDIG